MKLVKNTNCTLNKTFVLSDTDSSADTSGKDGRSTDTDSRPDMSTDKSTDKSHDTSVDMSDHREASRTAEEEQEVYSSQQDLFMDETDEGLTRTYNKI